MPLLSVRTANTLRVSASRAPLTNNAIYGSRSLLFSTSQNTCSENSGTTSTQENKLNADQESSKGAEMPQEKVKKKTIAELDEELKLKMESMSGGGGSAGVEYENGKAEGLKRGVKDNMFRVI